MAGLEFDSGALAQHLAGAVSGSPVRVSRLTSAASAGPDTVVVAADSAHVTLALRRSVGILIVPRGLDLPSPPPCAIIEVADTRAALAQLTALFERRPLAAPGIHGTAVVAADASLGEGVSVGAHTVIEARASIGDGSTIGPHCTVGAGARLGRHCLLHAGVVLYHAVQLGDRVELHSGCVIGADGFGYAPGPGGPAKIHQLGTVRIGDDVEIGANSAVDRGTLDATCIGDRSKIDNHCQIGHNVTIGTDCLIAGMTGIAGSTVIGDRAVLGGYVAVADHVRIGSDARIGGRSGVTKDVPDGETWAGFPAQPYRRWVRGLYLQGKLERIWAFVQGRHDHA